MGAKRTVGPWEVNKYGGHIEIQQSDPDGISIAIMSSGSDADAYLIAASPDTYDACKQVMANLDYLQELWGQEGITDRVVSILRAAIAKAEGGGA